MAVEAVVVPLLELMMVLVAVQAVVKQVVMQFLVAQVFLDKDMREEHLLV
jgi:hypothetical protein